MALVCDRCTNTIIDEERRHAVRVGARKADLCSDCYYRQHPCLLCCKDVDWTCAGPDLHCGPDAINIRAVPLEDGTWDLVHYRCLLKLAREHLLAQRAEVTADA